MITAANTNALPKNRIVPKERQSEQTASKDILGLPTNEDNQKIFDKTFHFMINFDFNTKD